MFVAKFRFLWYLHLFIAARFLLACVFRELSEHAPSCMHGDGCRLIRSVNRSYFQGGMIFTLVRCSGL